MRDGTAGDATTGASTLVDWPAATQAQTYFTPALSPNPDNTPRMWLGTFLQNGKGTTGMLYRRNRYFDTNTGRFTQEDPIGIAGGLNAYGFTDGDPVNFSDPFGLSPCPPNCDDNTDTSRPQWDPTFRAQLDAAGQRATAATWWTIGVFGIGESMFEIAKSVFATRAATATIRNAVIDGALAQRKGGYELGTMKAGEFSKTMQTLLGVARGYRETAGLSLALMPMQATLHDSRS